MSSRILALDLPTPDVAPSRTAFGNLQLARQLDIGGEADSASFPSLPSLLRKANRRYLMNRIDTTVKPDFATLTDISYDHDLFTAIGMIALDTIKKMELGDSKTDSTPMRYIEELDEKVNIPDLYRNVAYDELRYGNSLVLKRIEDKLFVDCEIIHPGRIHDMRLSPANKPMWWVFKQDDKFNSVKPFANEQYVAYVDPKYKAVYDQFAVTQNIVGEADEVVHFKGSALRYQGWGVGITQIAKLLIEAKIDMLIDFSKIIKMNASPREYVYVNVEGLRDEAAQSKIDATITELTKQRMLSSVIVLGDNEARAEIIGTEGKVLDNFTLHYRDDLLRAIRILTRVPPSFWLGEATNKATINSQLTVYNGFIDGQRWYESTRWERQIFLPYIKQFDEGFRLKDVPPITFLGPAIEIPMDKSLRDDIAIRNGSKSRKQVAEEEGYRLPEDDGLLPPEPSLQSPIAEVLKRIEIAEELKFDG